MPEHKNGIRNIYNYYLDPTKAISKIKADGLSCRNCPYLHNILVLDIYTCELFDVRLNNVERLPECVTAKPIH